LPDFDDALKKCRCCHKCCECTECTSRGSVPQFRYMHTGRCRIPALLSLLNNDLAMVEVFHEAASVHSSSKITDSYVASFPGLPHIIAFSLYIRHFRDHQCSFRTSIQVWQRFPGVHRFSATIVV